eukprot:CAMPEP_0204225500 /NCGR_PEP_ID=MMETSP0361-20130328/84256_1 /ASSEMBLY_ACC=CAM_ASM_000343 /TAXON_ID=268821 /ORGANISM="Scrippsiella Hangoei, Strain SHTV-5" /LENGTH=54 /DNA_ID=CAMNT_0051192015 /DNA_START=28 /DNA_END=188 /DNA_ORIENTATION=+
MAKLSLCRASCQQLLDAGSTGLAVDPFKSDVARPRFAFDREFRHTLAQGWAKHP